MATAIRQGAGLGALLLLGILLEPSALLWIAFGICALSWLVLSGPVLQRLPRLSLEQEAGTISLRLRPPLVSRRRRATRQGKRSDPVTHAARRDAVPQFQTGAERRLVAPVEGPDEASIPAARYERPAEPEPNSPLQAALLDGENLYRALRDPLTATVTSGHTVDEKDYERWEAHTEHLLRHDPKKLSVFRYEPLTPYTHSTLQTIGDFLSGGRTARRMHLRLIQCERSWRMKGLRSTARAGRHNPAL